jgi:spore germination protein YaaH/flagellar hook assembly protein FlgD
MTGTAAEDQWLLPSTYPSIAPRPANGFSGRLARVGTAAVFLASIAVAAPMAGGGGYGGIALGALGDSVGSTEAGTMVTAAGSAGSALPGDPRIAIDATADTGIDLSADGLVAAPIADPPGIAALELDGAQAATPQAASAPEAGVATPADTSDDGPIAPSVAYEDAAAHAGDRIDFTPGGTVSVAFHPSSTDGWPVDGDAPEALPAGAASGRSMAGSKQGSDWAGLVPVGAGPSAVTAGTDSPIDGSAVGPGSAVPTSGVGPANTNAPAAAARSSLNRQVFGFLPYWTLADRSTVLDFGLLSTIAYFGVGADRNGNLLKKGPSGRTTTGWGGWTSSKLTAVIDAAHRHHVRVVLTVTVFAWTSGQATSQAALLGNARARLNLARQIAAAVRDRGADGVNLDFEPIASGHADDFTTLVRTLRSQLDHIHRGYQLTFDTTGAIGNYPIEDATAPGGADAIFIMGYDYRTSSATKAGSIDPLGGPGYSLDDTIDAYTQRVSPSKLILGLPYYGRAWTTTSASFGAATLSGPQYPDPASVTYASAVALGKKYGVHYDAASGTAWFAYRKRTCTKGHGCVTAWRQVYYDDARTLQARYDIVIRSGLRGSGIWALGYDEKRPELYSALDRKYVQDTTAPEAGVAVLPATIGNAGFVVSWRATDLSAIRSYDVQVAVDRGPWTAWRTKTTLTSDVYLGNDGHSYAFRVLATDGSGNVGAWDIGSRYDSTPSLTVGGFGRVTVDTVSARTAPDTSALAVATLRAGQTVAVIGGPRSADGYTWYRITGPLAEWDTVGFTRRGMWVPVRSASRNLVTAAVAPNSTVVDAGIDSLTFGDVGRASLGPGPTALLARVFSPNGDGSRDRLRIRWTNHIGFSAMSLRILRPNGTVVGSRRVPDIGFGAQSYDWDGRLDVGRPIPDGTYILQLVGRAGGRTYAAPSIRPTTPAQLALYTITIDRVPPRIHAATSTGARISPNGDGRMDSVTITATASGSTHWTLTVARMYGGKVGPVVRTIAGDGTRTVARWNGRNDDGAVVPDGSYRLSIIAWDPAGNRAVRSGTIVVDDTRPTFVLNVNPARIAPDGDGVADTATATWTASEPVSGILAILHGTTIVRSWSFAGSSGRTATWDGRDARHRPVPEGTYTIRLGGYDATGNLTIVSQRVVVDRTVGALRWGPATFDPQDGDRLVPTSKLSLRLSRAATVTVTIVGPGGAVVRTLANAQKLRTGSHGWTWDGRATGGAWAAPGTYTAVIRATSSRGTTTLQRSIFAGAFAMTPSASVVKAGQRLTVVIASVEPLNGSPTVTFTQSGKKARTGTVTPLGGGRYKVTFTIAAGGKGPATIAVSGRDSAGGLNRASATSTVR